ncbi:MAG: transglycosylase domain-containing protein, partial [Oscillospiraceae bacterium]
MANNKDTKQTTKKRKKKGVSPKFKKIIINTLLFLIISGSIGVIALSVSVMKAMENDEALLDLNNLELNLTTILYTTNSKTGEVTELDRLHGTENRIWVNYDDIPKHIVDAFIAIEDKRYYEHKGVDIKRTLGSIINVFIPIYTYESGGSTITQQLVKNLTNDWDKTWFRKITEIVRSYNLNRNYTKEKILESYLNTINLASGNQGIRAAANHFFAKEVNQLTITESASIAAITKNPSRFNPYTKSEENKKRRDLVLKEMLDQSLISQEDFDVAINEELVLNSNGIEKRLQPKSWFVDQVINDTIDDFVANGMSKDQATKLIYHGGLRIYTTIDTELQKGMDEVYSQKAKSIFPNQRGDVQPESAMVIMSLEGQIRGLIGGLTKEKDRVLNRGTSSVRQPGSAMKPIGTYTAAIDRGVITMGSIRQDTPVEIIDGKPWPQNYYGSYDGNMTVSLALRRSVNTVPAKLVGDVGFDISYDYLKNKFKISSLDQVNDKNASSLALGGMTYGVKPVE